MFLDLSSVVVKSNNTPLPAGKYQAKVVEVEVKETKSKTGRFIKMKLVVCEGEFEGKSVYTNFNIKNESKKAQEIGLESLKRFLIAADMDENKLEKVTDLVGKKVTMATKLVENNKGNMVPEVHYFDRAEKKSDGII